MLEPMFLPICSLILGCAIILGSIYRLRQLKLDGPPVTRKALIRFIFIESYYPVLFILGFILIAAPLVKWYLNISF